MEFIGLDELKAEFSLLREALRQDLKSELREFLDKWTLAAPSMGGLRQAASVQWVNEQRRQMPDHASNEFCQLNGVLQPEDWGLITEVVPFAPPVSLEKAKVIPQAPPWEPTVQEDKDPSVEFVVGEREVGTPRAGSCEPTADREAQMRKSRNKSPLLQSTAAQDMSLPGHIDDRPPSAAPDKKTVTVQWARDTKSTLVEEKTPPSRLRRVRTLSTLRRCSSQSAAELEAQKSFVCPCNFRRWRKFVRTVKGQAKARRDRFGLEDFIDVVVSISIVLNGIMLGLQADHQARNATDQIPLVYAVTEIVFCIVFTCELGVKLCRYRLRLYTMPAWRWNVFDTALVSMQLGDVLMEVIFTSSTANAALDTASTMKNASFLRLLRLLRLLRILRLLRLLHFFSELNVVTAAILSSLKSLLGTTLMLIMVMYIIGIVITQVTTSHRVSLQDAGEKVPADLVEWWGTLSRSMLSLYESFLGGVDWDTLVQPLVTISPFLAIAFVLYIAFITLAMMNVITGIFVESAIKNAEREKDKVLSEHVKELHGMIGDSEGRIGQDDFRRTLKDRELQHYFAEMGIDQNAAVHLFDLLSADREEGLSVEELVRGIIRMRESAKYLDIMAIMHNVEQCSLDLQSFMDRTNEVYGHIFEQCANGNGSSSHQPRFTTPHVKGSEMLR